LCNISHAENLAKRAISRLEKVGNRGKTWVFGMAGIVEAWQRDIDQTSGKLQEQLSETQKESGEAKERSDTLLLNLQRQLEQSQMMLESSQAKQRRSWWSRLWKRTPDETN